MSTTKTYLAARNPTATDVTIYAEYSHNRKVKRVPTGERVALERWDKITRSVTGTGSTALNKTINKVLATLEAQVQALYLANGNVYPTVEQLSQQQSQQATQIQTLVTESPLTDVLVTWLGTKVDWAYSTHQNFNTVLANIRDYQQARSTTWYLSKLTTEDIRDWQQYLKSEKQGKHQQGYNDQTLHKRVRLLRQFLRQHTAPHVQFEKDGAKALHKVMLTTPFVLNKAELNALELLDLSHDQRLSEVRDLMLLQAFCGLRFSDLSRLATRHIVDGRIVIQMKKSGAKATKVHIPLVRQSRQVLAKYTIDNVLRLPVKYSQEYNNTIRAICRLVPALREDHTQDRRLRGELYEHTNPKYKFITSHTMRRTFVSIFLSMNFPTKDVMSWSGHTTMAAFQRYIGATEQRSDSGKVFDELWDLTQQKPTSTEAVSLTLSQEVVRELLASKSLSAEAKQVLSIQYATSMRP